MKHKNYILLMITFTIIACTTFKEPTTNWDKLENNINTNFSTNGKITIVKDSKAMYANFYMENNNKFNHIQIYSPLGNAIAQICTDENGAILIDDKQKVYRAKSANELAKEITNYELPLDKLPLWISGKYLNNEAYHVNNNNELLQYGWIITRKTDKQVPTFLKLKKDNLTITMIFFDFNNLSTNNNLNCKQELNIAN